ncbi:nucleoside hydrolase [Corynebacterium gerontici]|nr:nucleoside hydrolase [Corynebacterium gerontici]
MTPQPTLPAILADVDTGIDDMLALIYLGARHCAGEIVLAGVSVNAGNTTAVIAANNTRFVLDLVGCQDVPVAVGATAPLSVPLTITPETHGPAGLGYIFAPGNEQVKSLQVRPGVVPDAAVMEKLAKAGALVQGIRSDAPALWANVLRAHPDCRLLVSGPGTLLAQHAQIARRFAQITVMGGAVDYPGNTTPNAEWNFWSDPEGAQTLLSFKPTLLSLQISEGIIVTPSELATWQLHGPLHTVVGEALRFYFEFHQAMGEGYVAQVHDLAAATVALDAVPYSTRTRLLRIDPQDRGAVLAGQGEPVDVITRLDASAVFKEFRRALALLDNR